MDVKKNSLKAKYKTITIRTIDGATLQGKVNLSDNKRVSDLFTVKTDSFIVMVDVVFKDYESKVMFINKEHIVWVEPETD